jgi:hypothetical protein
MVGVFPAVISIRVERSGGSAPLESDLPRLHPSGRLSCTFFHSPQNCIESACWRKTFQAFELAWTLCVPHFPGEYASTSNSRNQSSVKYRSSPFYNCRLFSVVVNMALTRGMCACPEASHKKQQDSLLNARGYEPTLKIRCGGLDVYRCYSVLGIVVSPHFYSLTLGARASCPDNHS